MTESDRRTPPFLCGVRRVLLPSRDDAFASRTPPRSHGRSDPGSAPRPRRRPGDRDPAGPRLALQRLERQRRRRRPAVARADLRLGRRRPLLRAQRLPDGPDRARGARPHRRLRRTAVHPPPGPEAVAGAVPLPHGARALRCRAAGLVFLAERAARAELRRHVAVAPVVTGRRGALLPGPGGALPAVRPPPGVAEAARRDPP